MLPVCCCRTIFSCSLSECRCHYQCCNTHLIQTPGCIIKSSCKPSPSWQADKNRLALQKSWKGLHKYVCNCRRQACVYITTMIMLKQNLCMWCSPILILCTIFYLLSYHKKKTIQRPTTIIKLTDNVFYLFSETFRHFQCSCRLNVTTEWSLVHGVRLLHVVRQRPPKPPPCESGSAHHILFHSV